MTYWTQSTRAIRRGASSTKPTEAGSCRGWRRKRGAAPNPFKLCETAAQTRHQAFGQAADRLARRREIGKSWLTHHDGCQGDHTHATNAHTKAVETVAPT